MGGHNELDRKRLLYTRTQLHSITTKQWEEKKHATHCKRIGKATKEAKEIGKTMALEATYEKLEPPEMFGGRREGE